MEKIIIKVFIVLTAVFLQVKAYSQNASMQGFVKNSMAVLEKAEEKKLQIARAEYDMIYSNKKISWRKLYKGVSYQIMAYADGNVKDLDLAVYEYKDGEWKKLVKDGEDEKIASVLFKPEESKEYKIELSVYEFEKDKDSAKYCLLYLIQ